MDLPTLELASVRLKLVRKSFDIRTESRQYLFRVVDLPDDGFPTRPMSGSRGIVPFKTTLRSTSSMLLYQNFVYGSDHDSRRAWYS